MLPFIIKLVSIFRKKKKVHSELKESLRPIARIIKGLTTEFSEETQDVVLHKHTFGEDTGLLPLVATLIKANDELVHYKDDEDKISMRDEFGINMASNLANCGTEISRTYRDMMSFVVKEQYFLVNYFKPFLQKLEIRK